MVIVVATKKQQKANTDKQTDSLIPEEAKVQSFQYQKVCFFFVTAIELTIDQKVNHRARLNFHRVGIIFDHKQFCRARPKDFFFLFLSKHIFDLPNCQAVNEL